MQDENKNQTEETQQDIALSGSDSDNTQNTELQPAAENAQDDKADENQQIEVHDAQELEEQPDDYEEPEPYVPKLTPKQQKMWQIILGWVCGFAVMFSLFLSSTDPDNQLLSWLFLIVFVIIMVTRTQVEKRTGVRLNQFMKYWIISLAVFLAIYFLYGIANGKIFME